MEEYIQESLTDQILEEASKRFDFQLDTLQKVGGFENFVYQYTKEDIEYILRFVHSGHRSYDLVLAEIEFIDYLSHHGASVSTVIHSIHDAITEKIMINDKDYFSVTSFTKAPGTYVKQDEKTPELFYMLGKEIGRMHHLTKRFKPEHRRIHWYEENFTEMALRVLPKEDGIILDKYNQIVDKIKQIPTTKDNYGLIHTDLHFGNIYFDGNTLTIFDFDDSAYKHFLSDIAIVLYYDSVYQDKTKEEYNQRSRFVLHHLMRGYREMNELNDDEFQYLNEFLYLRSVILYIVLVAAGLHTTSDPRRKAFMDLQRKRVMEHSMEVDLDFVLGGL